MSYILGSLITLATIYLVAGIFMSRIQESSRPIRIVHSQSRMHYMIGNYSGYQGYSFSPVITQSSKHLEQTNFRVIILNDLAYWVKDNNFYVAEMNNGILNESTTQVVDIMGMDRLQLEEMSFIIEKLTEGTSNDTRNSGDS